MYKMLEETKKNQNNPMDLLKEVTKNYTPEQMNNLFEQSKKFGVPEDMIKQIEKDFKK